MANDTANPTVNVGTLAKLFSLTEVRVQQLEKMGVVVRVARGKYDLWQSIRGYIKYLQDRAFGKKESDIGGGANDLQSERKRLTSARADIAEIEANLMKAKVHDAEIVAEIWADMATNVKAKVGTLPVKCAGDVYNLFAAHVPAEYLEKVDLVAVRECMGDTCRNAMKEVSEYDASSLVQKFVAERQQDLTPPESEAEPEEAEQAAQAEPE